MLKVQQEKNLAAFQYGFDRNKMELYGVYRVGMREKRDLHVASYHWILAQFSRHSCLYENDYSEEKKLFSILEGAKGRHHNIFWKSIMKLLYLL